MYILLPQNTPITEKELVTQLNNGGRPWKKKGLFVELYNDEEFGHWQTERQASQVAYQEQLIQDLWEACQNRMIEITGDTYKAASVAAMAVAGNYRALASFKWMNGVLWGKKGMPAEGSYYWRKAKLLRGEKVSMNFSDLGEAPYTFDEIMEVVG